MGGKSPLFFSQFSAFEEPLALQIYFILPELVPSPIHSLENRLGTHSLLYHPLPGPFQSSRDSEQ